MNAGELDRAAMQQAMEKARVVKQAHEAELLGMPNVVGVGVGLRQQGGMTQNIVSLVVLVRQKKPSTQLAPEQMIPAELEGVPVDVQEVGDIGAQ
jgi:hypothetical protein